MLRPKSDWASFRPLLETVVSLKREVAGALSARLGLDPYDSLVDGYEPEVHARSAAVLQRLLMLYQRTLDRLAAVAEQIESAVARPR